MTRINLLSGNCIRCQARPIRSGRGGWIKGRTERMPRRTLGLCGHCATRDRARRSDFYPSRRSDVARLEA